MFMAPTIPLDYTKQRESKKLTKTGTCNVMGKTRKVSKAYPTGFLPGYRHDVKTMVNLEGFVNCGRVNGELAASGDSSDLKRNCISFNMEGNGRFGTQMRFFSLSKMSHSERRDLELRLKTELEQVRMLQNKVASSNFHALGKPPYMDNPNRKNRYVRPDNVQSGRDESNPVSVNVVPEALGKKKDPAGRNGPRTKGGFMAVSQTESLKQGLPQNANFALLMKQCQSLLSRVMLQKYSKIFHEPVDIVKHQIPDYFDIIKHPMDLGTVEKKLHAGEYSNPMKFAADVRLTFKNAMIYNPPGHAVYIMAETMSKYFEIRWKSIEKKIPTKVDEPTASKSSVIIEPLSANMPPVKKQKTNNMDNKVKQETSNQLMSNSEKLKLSTELEALMGELPDEIIGFFQANCSSGCEMSEDEIEIDMDSLSDDALFVLRKLLDDYLVEKNNQSEAEPCEIKPHHEMGFSNTSVLPQKENDLVEESVDIRGDELPPVSSCAPVEFEKDTARNKSSCSSSGGSSSESGFSSSDSGSSSASAMDGEKNSILIITAIENADPRSGEKETNTCNHSEELWNEQSEQNLPSKSSSADPFRLQEGESGPPDRQVSPEKLYRAALLRSRFADIIIKAQENTSEKGERPDPHKLTIGREELAKRRREEKARLQAEAKAAEEARRRAEGEAAAEAKRKRELEREAARLALQQMEKTVDINENSQFMEDLGMFTAATDENLQNLMEAVSPENSEDGLGSFKFPVNGNPLEQLGLYMKNDDEEEDDGEAKSKSSPSTSDDPEEGEIN